MKPILWFDSVGGASGDMILACLMDLGVPADTLNAALRDWGPFHLSVEAHPHQDHGLHGTRAHVETRAHSHATHAAHPAHRGLAEIAALIDGSSLAPEVKRQSVAVFRRLAEAEARVHATAPEAIHFHEVGALDAIADIVGACVALSALGVDGVGFSPLPCGHGTIHCAHGVLPNPAPATVELLKGRPVTLVDEPFELVTPTGAALLTAWESLKTRPANMAIARAGHGFGQRRLNGRPNLLRALLLAPVAPAADSGNACLVLETNIDDTTPELIGALVQKLLAAGAWDAFTTAIQMKKQRPGVMLTVLCAPEQRETMVDLIFDGSTTFGIREHLTHRTVLAREVVTVQTPFGAVRVKTGIWRERLVTAAPEYEDCSKAADAAGVPVRTVYEAAQAEGQRLITRSSRASAVSAGARQSSRGPADG
jgi:uncharacterized protein (TIGR00299 family) protein